MTGLIILNSMEELCELRALYQRDWPRHYLGYNTLDNFARWGQQGSTSECIVYSLSEQSWRERGLYLIVHRHQLFVNSLLAEDASLGVAIKQLEWSQGYKITSVPKQQYAIVTTALRELNISHRSAMMNVYRLPKEVALKRAANLLIPAGLELQPLKHRDADAVNDAWPSHEPGSQAFIEDLIKYNVSICVVVEQTKELAAWCTRCQCGFLGTLHVIPAYRRRGLATLLTNYYAAEVAKHLEQDVFTLVYEHNEASNQLFQKLSFTLLDNVSHIRAFRTDPSIASNYK